MLLCWIQVIVQVPFEPYIRHPGLQSLFSVLHFLEHWSIFIKTKSLNWVRLWWETPADLLAGWHGFTSSTSLDTVPYQLQMNLVDLLHSIPKYSSHVQGYKRPNLVCVQPSTGLRKEDLYRQRRWAQHVLFAVNLSRFLICSGIRASSLSDCGL